jgi:hypothetical protein
LAETLSGSAWTGVASGFTPPAGATSTLNAISCTSVQWCIAAGSYTDSAGNGHALFDTLSNGSWSTASAPDPTGATYVDVESLSCSSSTSCLAVGYWGTSDTTAYALLETFNGSTWTASTLGSGSDVMRSLSCPAPTSCMAVGYNTSGQGVTETLTDGTWTQGLIPIPAGTSENGFVGVSCSPDITSCVALGGYRQPAGNSTPDTQIETLASGVWTPTLGIDPSTGYGFPFALACPSITSCVGVGVLDGFSTYPMVVTASGATSITPSHGYWLVGSDGGIFSFGSAQFHGSTGSITLNRPVVGITPTADDGGYWLVASDGGIFAFGDANFVGSMPGLGFAPAGTVGGKHLNAPIVGMVPSESGTGYFMVASDGGVFAFNAPFAGSCPGLAGGCSGAAVGVAPDHSGNGYWLVTATGHVYAFGDAQNFGAPGLQSSNVTSIVRTPDGNGYWILDANGGVFAYGDAASLGALPAGAAGGLDPASAIFSTSDGNGYWVATALGKVYDFGDAPSDGDMSGTHLNGAIIAATGF